MDKETIMQLVADGVISNEVAERYFPELKENERIRKEILDYIDKSTGCKRWVAWLEEQGEQKPFDYENANIQQKDFASIEPRFKVGDWVVVNNKHQSIYQVEKIENRYYILRHTHGGTFRVCVLHDESLRLWDISDAKDGDVLVASDGSIFLFAGVVDCACKYYAALATDNYVEINKEAKDGYWETSRAVIPATKEQRDKFEKAMSDAGYAFDFKKKELRKLKFIVGDEIKSDNEEPLTITKIDENGYWSEDLFICGFDDAAKWELVGQKSAWSEEDENMFYNIYVRCTTLT